jgi:hypothetical protein
MPVALQLLSDQVRANSANLGWHHQRPFFQLLLLQVSASGVQLFYSKGLDLYSTGSVTFQGF